MKKHNIVAGLAFLIAILCFWAILGSTQLYWWDLWDENIKQNLLAKNDKCNNIILKNIQDSETDLINYERTGEDNNVFDINSICYKLRNDFNFVYNYRLKVSHFSRGLTWIIILCMALFVSAIARILYDED